MIYNVKHICYKASIILLIILFTNTDLNSQDTEEAVEIPSQFDVFTSENFKGFTKPLFTTVGQGAQSNLYTKAMYPEVFTFGLDISVASMIIPESQKSYKATLPEAVSDPDRVDNAYVKDGNVERNVTFAVDEPTIYGGESNTVYVAAPIRDGDPRDSIYKSISYLEGNNISTMLSTPAVQLMFGFPSRTQLRVRYIGAALDDKVSMSYFGFNVNQQVDHWFDLFRKDEMMALALNGSLQFYSVGNSLDMTSFSIGAHFSKSWDNGLSVYSGLQYENLSGEFLMRRENGYDFDFYYNGTDSLKPRSLIPTEQKEDYDAHVAERQLVADSPYEEVRLLKPFRFDIESFTSWRFLVGTSYRYGVVELHLDLGYASQPFLNGGISIWFGEWGDEKKESEELENNIEG